MCNIYAKKVSFHIETMRSRLNSEDKPH